MTIGIELGDRMYRQITDFCVLNNLDMKAYLEEKVASGFSVDMYGDLNGTIMKHESEDISKEFAVEPKNVFEGFSEAKYDADKGIVVFKSENGEEYKMKCIQMESDCVSEVKETPTVEEKKIKRRQIKSK